MSRRVFAAFVLLAAASLAATAARLRPPAGFRSSPERSGSPVESLDETIQARFQDLESFGMARIPQHIGRFTPGTAEEVAAVAELESDGWGAAFYLGGRRLLGAEMSESEWQKLGKYDLHQPIKKPVVVAGAETLGPLPRPLELWALGREALAATATADSFTRSFGRWSVDVRPVRANRQDCLDCHRSAPVTGPDGSETRLKIGDPLGVVIYLYTRTPG